MNICFISGSYPSVKMPQHGVFLQQIARSMANYGHNCTVISPVSVFKKNQYGIDNYNYIESDSGVKVKRPLYLSFSQKKIGCFNTGLLTQKVFERTVLKTINSMPEKPDILYGMFLYMGGKTAVWCGQKLGIPAVVEVGEGVFWSIAPFGRSRAGRELRSAEGFRALGQHLADALVSQLGISKEKIKVIANGVNRNEFKPMDQAECRQKLGLPQDKFIITFVGTFNENKGGPELLRAVEQIPDCYLLMIGSGPLDFVSPRILFKGLVAHEKLPEYYNAGDIFVLPTRIEGSCNVAIEAMACGLPIVTSNGPHMADIADESNALTVDECSVDEIYEAILKLKNDINLRRQLSAGSLKKAQCFTIENRAEELTSWFDGLKNKHE